MKKIELIKHSIGQSLIAKLEQLTHEINVIVQTEFAQFEVELANCMSFLKCQLNVPFKVRISKVMCKESDGLCNREEKV